MPRNGAASSLICRNRSRSLSRGKRRDAPERAILHVPKDTDAQHFLNSDSESRSRGQSARTPGKALKEQGDPLEQGTSMSVSGLSVITQQTFTDASPSSAAQMGQTMDSLGSCTSCYFCCMNPVPYHTLQHFDVHNYTTFFF